MNRWIRRADRVDWVAIDVNSAAFASEVAGNAIFCNRGLGQIIADNCAATAIPIDRIIPPGNRNPGTGASGNGKTCQYGIIPLAVVEHHDAGVVNVGGGGAVYNGGRDHIRVIRIRRADGNRFAEKIDVFKISAWIYNNRIAVYGVCDCGLDRGALRRRHSPYLSL